MKINRSQYPELDLILWDVHAQMIGREHAFKVYEARWKFVNPQNLKENERLLIESLTKEFGNGLFLPVS